MTLLERSTGLNDANFQPGENKLRKAYLEWKAGLASLRSLAEKLDTPKSTIFRQFQKLKKAEEEESKAEASQTPTDEELEKLKIEVKTATNLEELAKAKYLTELERDHHRREAWKFQRILEEYEASHDRAKMLGLVEKVLSEAPEKLGEIRQHLQRLGLTFEEFMHKELTADDYKDRREYNVEHYPNYAFPTLGEDIIQKVDGWLAYENIQSGKPQAKRWMEDHPPQYECPDCGSKLIYTKSGVFSCQDGLTCGWEGFFNCPNCGKRMKYDRYRKNLYCPRFVCGLVWRQKVCVRS